MAMLLIIFAIGTHAQEIQFENMRLEEALLKAEKENKPIFIDCYTKWCGACKVMAKTAFKEKMVADFYNTNFINLKIDMEEEDKDIVNSIFKCTAFPTLLYINADKELMYVNLGALNGYQLVEIGKKAIDPNQNLLNIDEEYAKGNRDAKFLRSYITAKSAAGHEVKEATDYFFTKCDLSNVFDKQGHDFFTSVITGVEHPGYKFYFEHQDEFAKAVTRLNARLLIETKMVMDIVANQAKNNALDDKQKVLSGISPKLEGMFDRLRKIVPYAMEGKKRELVLEVYEFAKLYNWDFPGMLAQSLSTIFNANVKGDKECIAKAEELVEQFKKISPNPEMVEAFEKQLEELKK